MSESRENQSSRGDGENNKSNNLTRNRNNNNNNRRGRAQNFRKARNTEAVTNIKKDLDANLFAEYSNLSQAFTSLQISEQKTAITLPITTRGIGLLIGKLCNRISTQLPNINIPINAWYRVTLAQTEAKIYDALQCHTLPQTRPYFNTLDMTLEQRSVIGSIAVNLAPLTNVINSIGNFVVNDVTYYVGVEDNVLTPMLTTLRQYAIRSAMNNDQGYSTFANIPGTRWVRREGILHLDNPDDVIPNEYGIRNLRDDINDVKAFIAQVTRKLPKYNGSITYGPEGSRAQLVSLNLSAERITCFGMDRILFHGENVHFTTALPISQHDQTIGMTGLLGEFTVMMPANIMQAQLGVRSPYSQSRSIAALWEDVVAAVIS